MTASSSQLVISEEEMLSEPSKTNQKHHICIIPYLHHLNQWTRYDGSDSVALMTRSLALMD